MPFYKCNGSTWVLQGAKPEEEKTVTPDFSSGSMIIFPTAGSVLTQVIIPADPNHVEGNIKKGVTMMGKTGTYEGAGGTPLAIMNLVIYIYSATEYSYDGGIATFTFTVTYTDNTTRTEVVSIDTPGYGNVIKPVWFQEPKVIKSLTVKEAGTTWYITYYVYKMDGLSDSYNYTAGDEITLYTNTAPNVIPVKIDYIQNGI